MQPPSILNLACLWLNEAESALFDIGGEARIVRINPLLISDDYLAAFPVLKDERLESLISSALFNQCLLNVKLRFKAVEFCTELDGQRRFFALRLLCPSVRALPESKLIRLKRRPARAVNDSAFKEKFAEKFGSFPLSFPPQRLSCVRCAEFYDLTRPFSDSEEIEDRRARPSPALPARRVETISARGGEPSPRLEILLVD